MIDVKVEVFPDLEWPYLVTIRQKAWADFKRALTRDEYESLILQLTGQLARLDQEAQA